MDGIKLGEEVLGVSEVKSSFVMADGTIDIKAITKLGELKVVGVDHNALVIECASGRTMLVALSDLVDLEIVEREKRDEELREKMEALDRIKLRDYMDPNSKTKDNYED